MLTSAVGNLESSCNRCVYADSLISGRARVVTLLLVLNDEVNPTSLFAFIVSRRAVRKVGSRLHPNFSLVGRPLINTLTHHMPLSLCTAVGV
jgi:hypothetical protein